MYNFTEALNHTTYGHIFNGGEKVNKGYESNYRIPTRLYYSDRSCLGFPALDHVCLLL